MVGTSRIADVIVNPEETGTIHDAIGEGAYYGMQTFDQSLLALRDGGQGHRGGRPRLRLQPARLQADAGRRRPAGQRHRAADRTAGRLTSKAPPKRAITRPALKVSAIGAEQKQTMREKLNEQPDRPGRPDRLLLVSSAPPSSWRLGRWRRRTCADRSDGRRRRHERGRHRHRRHPRRSRRRRGRKRDRNASVKPAPSRRAMAASTCPRRRRVCGRL